MMEVLIWIYFLIMVPYCLYGLYTSSMRLRHRKKIFKWYSEQGDLYSEYYKFVCDKINEDRQRELKKIALYPHLYNDADPRTFWEENFPYPEYHYAEFRHDLSEVINWRAKRYLNSENYIKDEYKQLWDDIKTYHTTKELFDAQESLS